MRINTLHLKNKINQLITALNELNNELDSLAEQSNLIVKSKKNSVTDQVIDGVSIYNELKNYASYIHDEYREHRINNLFESFAQYMQSELYIDILDRISKQRVSRLFLSINTDGLPFFIKRGKNAQYRYYDIITK
jgi:hypothetical protein